MKASPEIIPWYSKEETVPKIFLEQCRKLGSQTAIRKKRYGIWKEYSWSESLTMTKYLAFGLQALGLKKGRKVCILGDNDPEYFWTELAVQSLGGVVVGIYIDAIPEEVKFIAHHSEASIIFAKDQEQVDKVLAIREELPSLRWIIYWEPKGLWFYEIPILLSFTELIKRGSNSGQGEEHFEAAVSAVQKEDLCVISYTSGTTGLPKGVMISHDYLIRSIRDGLGIADPWTDKDRYLSYIPPAWALEHCFWLLAMVSGASINFPESPETLKENIREVGPTVMCYTPRMWESIMSTNEAWIEDSTFFKRWLWKKLLPLGSRHAEIEVNGGEPGLFLKLINAVAVHLLFNQVKDKLGFTRLRSAWTGGAPLSPSCFGYFRALGLPIKQLYGATEVLGVCAHYPDDVKWETLGQIMPVADVKISEEGEIWLTSEAIFSGYYKEPEKTRDVMVDGCWFKTGDAGFFTEDGHLVFLDRMKDMVSLASGEKYAPQYIEGHLKFSPYIKDCMVTAGPERLFITALINIDYESVGKWAETNRINYTTYADLSQKPQVLNLIRDAIGEVNGRVPEAAVVHRFVNLPKEFDPDEGELTRTRKIRRSFVETKYEKLIAALYKGEEKFIMEIEIEYRDGKKNRYEVPTRIVSV